MKPEWGIKRTCQECGTKFYDMRKPEISCPKCGAAFVAQAAKPRRAKPEPKPEPVAKKPPPKKVDAGGELVGEAIDLEADDEEDEEVIEDTSDLGDDEDDVSEVMENMDGEKEA